MQGLDKLRDYAESKDDWYIKNQIWYIEQEIKIAINQAKIDVYKSLEKQ
jgi:hypothetical protein